MIEPTSAQVSIRDASAPDLLVVAPAGCGKTEALALRVQGLLERGDVARPRKVLVTTFSNRARDNIRERLQHYLPAASLRDRVTVTNFHGLASRLIRSHGNVVGLTPDVLLPDNDWAKQRCRELKFDYPTMQAVLTNLREAKQEARTDAEVEAYLMLPGREAALAIERERVALRLAQPLRQLLRSVRDLLVQTIRTARENREFSQTIRGKAAVRKV